MEKQTYFRATDTVIENKANPSYLLFYHLNSHQIKTQNLLKLAPMPHLYI